MNKKTLLIISIVIPVLGILFTLYLYTFVNGGNHWELFGTELERFLSKFKVYISLFFSLPLLYPLLIKKNKRNLIIALSTIVFFYFFLYSFTLFLD